MTKQEFLKKFEKLENENFHGEAIQLACEFYGDEKGVEMMKHINALHTLIGHLPQGLYEIRCMVWDKVAPKYYQDKE